MKTDGIPVRAIGALWLAEMTSAFESAMIRSAFKGLGVVAVIRQIFAGIGAQMVTVVPATESMKRGSDSFPATFAYQAAVRVVIALSPAAVQISLALPGRKPGPNVQRKMPSQASSSA